MISFIAIGGSGTGKSTIGNFFLSGGPKGPFETFQGVDSCNKHATMKTNSDGRSYTDTPGIPDTNPPNTKAYYNECINALKKDHSAIIFVFKYERIDYEMLRTSKLLFREMNKANCMKFLIVNDHNKYEFNDPPDQSEYKRLANEIESYTQVKFNLVFNVGTPESIKMCLECLAEVAKKGGEPLASPTLKNFDELGEWVNSLKVEKDFRLEAIKDHEAALERAEEEKKVLFWADIISTIFALLGKGIILGGTIALTGVPTLWPPSSLRNEEILSHLKGKKEEISTIQDEKILHEKKLKVATQELKEATDSFQGLRKAVGA